jgi:cell division protein FtsA
VVINPRVEEIFTLLKAKYTSLNVDGLIASNMILTGGGSELNHIAQTVGDIFSKMVKVVSNNDHGNPSYNTAFGMIKYIGIKQKQKFDLDKNLHNQSKLNKVWSWFKENI